MEKAGDVGSTVSEAFVGSATAEELSCCFFSKKTTPTKRTTTTGTTTFTISAVLNLPLPILLPYCISELF